MLQRGAGGPSRCRNHRFIYVHAHTFTGDVCVVHPERSSLRLSCLKHASVVSMPSTLSSSRTYAVAKLPRFFLPFTAFGERAALCHVWRDGPGSLIWDEYGASRSMRNSHH